MIEVFRRLQQEIARFEDEYIDADIQEQLIQLELIAYLTDRVKEAAMRERD